MKFRFDTICLVVSLLAAQAAFSQEQGKNSGKARIHGQLRNFGGTTTLEDFSDLQHIVPLSSNPVISMASDSSFSLEVTLQKPGYYRLGRNKLYLSPGDDMKVLINQASSSLSSFSGKGSEANRYLCNTPFPKGGSFVEMGKQIKSTPDSSFSAIMAEAAKRDSELGKLKGASANFIRLEKARIKADLIKSFEAVEGYLYIKFGADKSEAFYKEYLTEFRKISKPTKDSLLKNFADPEFLQLEVYRDIVRQIDLDQVRDAKAKQAMLDWQRAYFLAFQKIKYESDKKKLALYQDSINSIRTARYRDVLNQLLAEKLKFGNGDMALDLSVRQTDGSLVKLSSLKGKVIYIDIWATWCGPCMAEMPKFEALKKKYQDREDLAMVSLSVDDTDPVWLRDLDRRKPEGIQWRISRANLKDYEVETVPRYILIDKNFVIMEMNAPPSSDPRASSLIEKLLQK